MPGFEGGTPPREKRKRKESKELTVRPPENTEEYQKWKKRLIPAREVSSLATYPVDTWAEFGDVFSPEKKKIVLERQYPRELLQKGRFDLLYQFRTVQGGWGDGEAVKKFFRNADAIRSKLASLIAEGQLRSATYLLRTVEQFYPKRGISPAEFADVLPDYPTLPVSYEDMEAKLSPEKGDPKPIQDTLGFCVKEALLADLLHLSHDVETVASSHTLSDEAKDSALRPLRIAVRDAINGLEADIDRISMRLVKLYFGAAHFRLEDRVTFSENICTTPDQWRDNEDALNAVAAIVVKFDARGMGPWTNIAEGVLDAMKVAFGREPHNKGELRSRVDHLLDISHHDGNIMSWLGKETRRQEADELLHFPTLFFEFRRYVGERPGAEMVAFIDELFKLAKTESQDSIPFNVAALDNVPAFEKKYPLVSRTIRQTRDMHKFTKLLDYTIEYILDEYETGKRLSKSLPPRFLNSLKEEIDTRGTRVADLRQQLEKIKQAYGYRPG